MKFHIGSLPETPHFQPEETGWRRLREPNPVAMQFLAGPVGVVAAGVLGVLWYVCTPLSFNGADWGSQSLAILLVIILVIPVHELIHAAAHPGSGRTDNSVLGFWPAMILFYAHYLGRIRRNHFLQILLAPFLVLSVLPLLLCAVFQWSVPWLAFLSIWNALLACGDLFGFSLILAQVPRATWIRNQGYYSWWKPEAEEPVLTETKSLN